MRMKGELDYVKAFFWGYSRIVYYLFWILVPILRAVEYALSSTVNQVMIRLSQKEIFAPMH